MRAIDKIPFPPLSEEEYTLLTEAVREIESAWSRGQNQPAHAVQVIDDILRKAYQLDDETYERLSLMWDQNHHRRWICRLTRPLNGLSRVLLTA